MSAEPKPRKPRARKGEGTLPTTHVSLKREEFIRLQAYGARIGAPLNIELNPRQVILHLLTTAEKNS